MMRSVSTSFSKTTCTFYFLMPHISLVTGPTTRKECHSAWAACLLYHCKFVFLHNPASSRNLLL